MIEKAPKTRTFLLLSERTEGRANNSQRYGQPNFSHDGACLSGFPLKEKRQNNKAA
ncbi:hypothetical protein [Allorhizobium terrae]|uniref:hypothetical protein n=1 Tax=Allorhizobium terrae TaxID=1848972 RepID=UPI00164B8903|nr:hypothetical protein [Allorhizobium terrae]